MSGFPIRREQECLVVELRGKLTADDHFRFLQTAVHLAEDPSGSVILDFARVESMEAAAYFGLSHIVQLSLTRGGDLLLAEVRPAIRAALEESGLSDAVEIFPTVEEALVCFSQRRWW